MKGVGTGVRVGGCNIPFAHARFYAQIKPLGGADPGRPDASGTWMHLKYTGALTQSSGRSSGNPNDADYAPSIILVEFDSDGAMTLPYCGSLDIVGGLGDYLVNISVAEHIAEHGAVGERGAYPVAATGYQPSIKSLKRVAEVPFLVPDWHTRIWGYNSLDTLIENATGLTLAPSATEPGTRTLPGTQYNPTRRAIFVTGWIG